jgi:vacuolar protein sorting-associated protein 13D
LFKLSRDFQQNKFKKILSKKSQIPNGNKKNKSKHLMFEIHFRSNKIGNKYSILINNCRVITILDWLNGLKTFLGSNSDSDLAVDKTQQLLKTTHADDKPIEIKFNLTETDFVLIENTNSSSSQSVVLRITAFVEYNQRKLNKPFHSCIQSIDFFSCYMNAINETALTILDPTLINVVLKSKNNSSDTNIPLNDDIYYLDFSTDVIRLRFSYLDFRLFVKGKPNNDVNKL